MSMKRGFSTFDMGIGLVNKKNRIVSLPPTEPSLMAIVNVEDFVVQNGNESAVEMSSTERNEFEQSQIALESVCIV